MIKYTHQSSWAHSKNLLPLLVVAIIGLPLAIYGAANATRFFGRSYTPPVVGTDIIKNGSFETKEANRNFPAQWNWSSSPLTNQIRQDCTLSHLGKCSFRMIGGANNVLDQNIKFLSSITGDVLNFSTWYYTGNKKNDTAQFQIYLSIADAKGSVFQNETILGPTKKTVSTKPCVQPTWKPGIVPMETIQGFRPCPTDTKGWYFIQKSIKLLQPADHAFLQFRYTPKSAIWFDDVSLIQPLHTPPTPTPTYGPKPTPTCMIGLNPTTIKYGASAGANCTSGTANGIFFNCYDNSFHAISDDSVCQTQASLKSQAEQVCAGKSSCNPIPTSIPTPTPTASY